MSSNIERRVARMEQAQLDLSGSFTNLCNDIVPRMEALESVANVDLIGAVMRTYALLDGLNEWARVVEGVAFSLEERYGYENVNDLIDNLTSATEGIDINTARLRELHGQTVED